MRPATGCCGRKRAAVKADEQRSLSRFVKNDRGSAASGSRFHSKSIGRSREQRLTKNLQREWNSFGGSESERFWHVCRRPAAVRNGCGWNLVYLRVHEIRLGER